MKKNLLLRGRRNFLKTGFTGITGAAFFPSLLKGEKKAVSQNLESDKTFIYRTLGKTGLKLPIISMGVMNADNPQLVRSALNAGIIHLDTAHYYNRGRNERMIGEVIKDFPRDSFILATKARASTVDRESAPEGNEIKAETFQSFIDKVHISLKRLGVDYVDILYLHSAKSRKDALNEVVLKAMGKLKKDGKVRFVGISTHKNESEVIKSAIESKIYEVILTAYNFRQRSIQELKDAIAEATRAGLGIVAMKTQAGVYWDKLRTQPINMKAALKWVLLNKNIHTSIPGFTTFDQMETDLSLMRDLTLTPEEVEDLRFNQNPVLSGLYCQQCEECLSQCQKKVPIPTLMRVYMYAYGYKNLSLARETLHPLNLGHIPCRECNICLVKCKNGFNVRDKILDIGRIQNIPVDFIA